MRIFLTISIKPMKLILFYEALTITSTSETDNQKTLVIEKIISQGYFLRLFKVTRNLEADVDFRIYFP